MAVWDPKQNKTVENYRHLVTNQSIVSLAWEPKSRLIFGGSGNWGGGGTRPVGEQAKFFAFDPRTKEKAFEAALVTGARSYPATIAADGKVYTTAGSKLLLFDPKTKQVTATVALPGGQEDISLGGHASGKLIGLAGDSVYVFDPAKGEIIRTERAPVPIRCGFALTDEAVYFGSGASLWRYRLPKGL
jgi:outer membrane protein assembly factor BamB